MSRYTVLEHKDIFPLKGEDFVLAHELYPSEMDYLQRLAAAYCVGCRFYSFSITALLDVVLCLYKPTRDYYTSTEIARYAIRTKQNFCNNANLNIHSGALSAHVIKLCKLQGTRREYDPQLGIANSNLKQFLKEFSELNFNIYGIMVLEPNEEKN